MYYSYNRTITCRLFLWILLFAIFLFVPDLQAEDSIKEKLIAPDMGSWINSIATFVVSLGVLFLLLVLSVLVIMFWGVVSSIKSIINVFTEKEREDMCMSQERRKLKKDKNSTNFDEIQKKLDEILNAMKKDPPAGQASGKT